MKPVKLPDQSNLKWDADFVRNITDDRLRDVYVQGQYGFEVIRVKLPYGKRGQVIDLSAYDVNGNDWSGGFGAELVFSALWPSPSRIRKRSVSTRRRGHNVREVEPLVEEGYYDLGNGEIANELEPLIASFARQY